MEMIKILITGATTTLGREVIKQLLRNRYCKVIVFESFSSKKEKYFDESKDNISVVYGSIMNKADIAMVTKNIDVVIHLLPVIHFVDDNNTRLGYSINVNGTKNLLDCLKNYSPNAFFMLASSMSVYGDRINNPMISLADPLAPSHYDYSAKIKIEVEDLVKSSGLEWTIFRLAALMGYGNYKLGGLIFNMPLRTPLEIITPKDAARAFVLAIPQQSNVKGKIFNIGGGETCRISYAEFLAHTFRIYGLGKLDFPAYAFAGKNFHYGYYADGDVANDLLSFRTENLYQYFSHLEKTVSKRQRTFYMLFRKLVKRMLLKRSHPYMAFKERDHEAMAHYF